MWSNSGNTGTPIIKTQEIRLAMLGMIEGNGHPYSWSAIFNGYDAAEMAKCPYPVIPVYLGKEPAGSLGVKGARVTHIWTDNPKDAVNVSKASFIPNIVEKPEDVIGSVDAVIIAVDDGSSHAERCRPFIEAGIPVFIDKPLADNERDLKIFSKWVSDGAHIMSSSCMRYAKEFTPYRLSTHEIGEICFASVSTPKTWERYGIHALESIYPILGPGFISVRNTGTTERNIVHIQHSCGADVVIPATNRMCGAFCAMQIYGTFGKIETAFSDTFYAFKAQLEDFIKYLRTGTRPFPFSETQELMKIIIAGTRSREDNGRIVMLDEIDI